MVEWFRDDFFERRMRWDVRAMGRDVQVVFGDWRGAVGRGRGDENSACKGPITDVSSALNPTTTSADREMTIGLALAL